MSAAEGVAVVIVIAITCTPGPDWNPVSVAAGVIAVAIGALLAAVYLVFAFCITLTWYFPRLGLFVPKLVSEFIYPIDKTNLDVLRILHFFALAVITLSFVPRGWPALKNAIFRPAILCGQHSLAVFCLGVFLAFAGHFVFTEISNRLLMHVLVSAAGIAIMVVTAALLTWYKEVERGPRPPSVRPGLAGGGA